MHLHIQLVITALIFATVFSAPILLAGTASLWLSRRWKFGPVLKITGWAAILIALILIAAGTHMGYRKSFAKGHEMFLPDVLRRMRGDIDEYHKKYKVYPRALDDSDFEPVLKEDWKENPLPAMYYDLNPNSLPEVALEFGLGHHPSAQVEEYPFLNARGEVAPELLRDTGHWLYDPKTGRLLVDCTHRAAIASWAVAGNPPIYTW